MKIHKKTTQEVDMLHGALAGKLILFAMPLALSSILQQLFNSADVAVVGQFVGSDALAATGSCVALVGIFVNLIVGLSVGPNAVLAMAIGRNARKEIHDILHTVIAFAIILGVCLLLVGMIIAMPVLKLSGTPETVLPQALLYIYIYFAGIPFMVIYNYGSAVLRSFGDSKNPMFIMVLSGTVNVILNLVFVLVFRLGVAGVALATSLSNLLSAGLILYLLVHQEGDFKLNLKELKVDRKYLRQILAIGIPAGFQGAIFSVSNVFIQAGINTFGKNAIAGSSLALNFEYFTYDIAAAFAQAATTFISQNYGAGQNDRCRRVFGLCMLFGISFTQILSIIFLIWDDFFIGIYTNTAAVAAFGAIRLWHVCSLVGLTATYEVGSAALRGYGKSLEPAIVTIMGTVVFRIVWMQTVFRIFPTYDVLMNVYPVSWVFTGSIILILYYRYQRKLARSSHNGL